MPVYPFLKGVWFMKKQYKTLQRGTVGHLFPIACPGMQLTFSPPFPRSGGGWNNCKEKISCISAEAKQISDSFIKK